ncbi:MAG: radical SAM protein [Kiritimatiellae bacterium]|nr:radical SAM protein [Kiritimatiellia bacterium]
MADVRGIVFDIRRGVTKDGPGLRTSVFLKGCPLRCAWCHNPESQSPEIERAVTTGEVCGREMTVDEVMTEVRRDAIFYAASGGGLTITGGEPMVQPRFTAALAAAAIAEEIGVCIDTSGFAPWRAFKALLAASPSCRNPLAGLRFLYDLKCLDPAKHRALTGVDNAPILYNLRRLDAMDARLWIRIPLAPGLNDSDADLAALRDFLPSLRNAERIDILPYHPLGLEKYAKFGKTPPYDRRDAATEVDEARWREAVFAAK